MGSCNKSLMSGGKRRSTKRSTRRRSTRRRRGGANAAASNGMASAMGAMNALSKAMGSAPAAAPKMAGGKRRHTKKANKWSQFVKQVYHKGKRADKDYTFAQALQEASKLKKAGKMHA
jgi:hypothetical protein